MTGRVLGNEHKLRRNVNSALHVFLFSHTSGRKSTMTITSENFIRITARGTVVDRGLKLRYVEKHGYWRHRSCVSGVLFHVKPALCVVALRLSSVPQGRVSADC
jgi:hypothetical protein